MAAKLFPEIYEVSTDNDIEYIIYHFSSKIHEEILEMSPWGLAHSFSSWTRVARKALNKLSVTLTQLMTALLLASLSSKAIRRSTITFPSVGDKVG